MSSNGHKPILVLGANGKTGRRVAARLDERGVRVRRSSLADYARRTAATGVWNA